MHEGAGAYADEDEVAVDVGHACSGGESVEKTVAYDDTDSSKDVQWCVDSGHGQGGTCTHCEKDCQDNEREKSNCSHDSGIASCKLEV